MLHDQFFPCSFTADWLSVGVPGHGMKYLPTKDPTLGKPNFRSELLTLTMDPPSEMTPSEGGESGSRKEDDFSDEEENGEERAEDLAEMVESMWGKGIDGPFLGGDETPEEPEDEQTK